MRLSRFGFNLLVLIWIAPVLLLDIYGNSTSTGFLSKVYYWKIMTDCLVAAVAGCFVYFKRSKTTVEEAHDETGETIISFSRLWLVEAYYCLLLSAYAGISWWTLHEVNTNTTGIQSFASLVWSFVCLIVALLGFAQFYNLKAKSIAELSKKMVQESAE